MGTFQPYKSPGSDGVYPVLLQEGLEDLRLPLTKICRATIALGDVPMAWRGSRVVLLPKPGREGYTDVRDFRPISLTSFILKVLERLVEKYIRDKVLTRKPLHSDPVKGCPPKHVDVPPRSALRIVMLWCNESVLSVNPEKTELLVFTRKYKTARVTGPVFCRKRLQAAQSVKYLGVILERKLN